MAPKWFLKTWPVMLVLSEVQAQGFKIGQAVKTTSGTYQGKAHKINHEVSEYLGIKFGKATRFSNPSPFNSSQAYEATKYGDDCPSMLSALPPGLGNDMASLFTPTGNRTSEDCLNLNIWTKPQSGEKAKAVLFWLFGGGFMIGSGSTAIYDGSTLANEEDVIVVTSNYRLSVFGFPGGPGVDQNPGLVDQRLATEWVRDNIAAFGGEVPVFSFQAVLTTCRRPQTNHNLWRVSWSWINRLLLLCMGRRKGSCRKCLHPSIRICNYDCIS